MNSDSLRSTKSRIYTVRQSEPFDRDRTVSDFYFIPKITSRRIDLDRLRSPDCVNV